MKSQVRVAGGRWRGRLLEVPAQARPTSGRAREALFSILSESLAGARVLDLYAGSGALGIEALSRGASSAVFVERDFAALERNLRQLQAPEPEAELLRGDVAPALRGLSVRGARFDLVFSDPPYRSPEADNARGVAPLVSAAGLLILQVDRPTRPGWEPEGWTLLQRRNYGRNVFLFLRPGSGGDDLSRPGGL